MKASYYYDAVMLDNPVVFYPLDESNPTDGTSAFDIASPTATARNATYVGAAGTVVPLVSGGEYGTSIGVSNYISIPALEQWSASRETSPFTFECWALLTEDNQNGVVLLQPYSTQGAIPGNYISIEDSQVIFKISNGNNYWASDMFAVAKHDLLEPRMSHHYVFSYANNILKIYVDSKLVDIVKVPFGASWLFDTSEFRIFNRQSSPFIIDAIAFYKGELSEASIQRHYLTGRSTIGSQEIARRTNGHFFPIDDIDSKASLDLDWPQDGKWPVAELSPNVVQKNRTIGLRSLTSPDTVDENIFFSNGAFQLIAGSKLLSDDMSTFNNGINLLENASFDVDTDGNGVPDMWVVENNSGGSLALSSDAVSSQNSLIFSMSGASVGTYLRITNTSKVHIGEVAFSGEPYGDLPVPIPSPKPYAQTEIKPTKMVFSFDAKGIVSNGLLNARIKQWNGATALTDLVIPVSVNSTWGRKQIPFNLFATATDVSVYIEVLAGDSCSANVYVDNAMLESDHVFNKYVDGWFKYSDTGTLPVLSRSNICDSGSSSLKVESSNESSTAIGIVSERLPADPGDFIHVRASAYSPAVVDFIIETWYTWFDINGSQIGSIVKYYNSIVQGEWTPVLATSEAPAYAATVQVHIMAKAATALGSGQEILFDNVYINELIEEAAQYLVIEEFSEIANLSEGSLDLEFYLSPINNDTKNTYVICSLDDSSNAIQIVKRYDASTASHKLSLRHIYTDAGTPKIYDTDIMTVTSFGAWHKAAIAWMGDEFYASIDSIRWGTSYNTSTNVPVQLSGSYELTVGAGIDGLNSLGTAVKNVNIYQTIIDLDEDQEYKNYNLPLSNDINIRMSGYAEFWLDFTPLYEAVDDVKIEWGPNNHRIIVYGGTEKHPTMPLENCGEPLPIKGGYCPSTISQKYYVRVYFNTDNLIYKPATLSYMSLTFLDDVKFKTKTAGHTIKPTGSFTVATRSTPIINQFYRNGVSFTAKSSKNLVVNGGFNYDTSGWMPLSYASCKIERSVDEYVSGGSSLKVTAYKSTAGFSNCPSGPVNVLPILINDIGDQGFNNYQNCEVSTTGSIKLISGMPVQKIKKNASGDVYFGSSTSNRIAGYDNVAYNVSLDIYRESIKSIVLTVDRYNSGGTIIGTQSLTVPCDTINTWQTASIDLPALANESSIAIKVTASNTNGWSIEDSFYLSNVKVELGSGSSLYEFTPSVKSSDVKLTSCSVSPGATYVVSSKFIADSGTANAYITIDYINSSFNKISSYTTLVSQINDESWVTVSGSFTTPSGTQYLAVSPVISGVQNGFVAYVDEIQVEPGSTVTSYEDNLPSGMYLELSDVLPVQTDDGYMGTMPRQQKVGTLEQWVRPRGVVSGTVLENVYTDGTKSGVYCTNNEITSQNMSAVYLNGAVVSSQNKYMHANEWNHVVAVPSDKTTIKNYVRTPGTVWNESSSGVSVYSSSIPSPGGDYSREISWEVLITPAPGAFGAETNCPIPPAVYYTVSFYIYSTVAANAEICVDWKNGSTVVKSSRSVIENTLTGKWVRKYATFMAPEGIDNASVSVGVSTGRISQSHDVATMMMSNEPYLTSYFDDGIPQGYDPENHTQSYLNMSWPSLNSIYSKWYWNTGFNGTGQMNASYSNITIHQNQLSADQVLDNYMSTLSRGTSANVSDNMTISGTIAPSSKITDGPPLLISAPWQINIGSS